MLVQLKNNTYWHKEMYLIADQIAASCSPSLPLEEKFPKKRKKRDTDLQIYDFAHVSEQCTKEWGCEKQGNTIKCWVTLSEKGNPANTRRELYLQLFWIILGAYLDFHSRFTAVNLNVSSKMWTAESERKQWGRLFPEVRMLRLVCLCICMTLFCKGKKKTVEGSLCFKQGQGEGIA